MLEFEIEEGKKVKISGAVESEVSKTVVVEPTKIYISGAIKKSTGNYGMIDVQFGITKPVADGVGLRQQADDIFNTVILEALLEYVDKLHGVSKQLDEVLSSQAIKNNMSRGVKFG